MLRLFILINFSILNIFACEGGYESCKQKLIDSKSITNNTIKIPVINNRRLIFSRTTPKAKILKYDPFLSLYLIEDKQKFKYPFKINKYLSLGSAMVNYTNATEIKIIKNQIGLNSLAKPKEKIIYPAIVTNSCCLLIGIVTPKGIIEKEYIQRFLSKENSSYSDIGIRVKNSKDGVVIKAVNPFKINNLFKIGDIIISHNNKNVKKASIFTKDILFSKISSKHKIKVARGNKTLIINTIATKRYGGGYISDTFLEGKGYNINKNLILTNVPKEIKNSLRVGDKILKVNNIKIVNRDDLLKNINNFKEKVTLLVSRDGFQFFINILI